MFFYELFHWVFYYISFAFDLWNVDNINDILIYFSMYKNEYSNLVFVVLHSRTIWLCINIFFNLNISISSKCIFNHSYFSELSIIYSTNKLYNPNWMNASTEQTEIESQRKTLSFESNTFILVNWHW